HLVFSTLHTNDAPSAMTRMVDLGVPGYLVATSVVAVLAQRLVRVVCAKCKQPYTPTAGELKSAGITPELAATGTFMKGKGCNACNDKGYRGRIGIYELMLLTPKIRELVYQNASAVDIRDVAVNEHMTTLYRDGIEKVLKGITTIEEVFRVAKISEADEEHLANAVAEAN
ncbi:MAG: Flp pilus assembly complex ATPase component TadA, partial [Planctomycetales bacterium]|nr:Flp pilus assembly complex ATPase component TadA [Planctomycetales bacterium]